MSSGGRLVLFRWLKRGCAALLARSSPAAVASANQKAGGARAANEERGAELGGRHSQPRHPASPRPHANHPHLLPVLPVEDFCLTIKNIIPFFESTEFNIFILPNGPGNAQLYLWFPWDKMNTSATQAWACPTFKWNAHTPTYHHPPKFQPRPRKAILRP